MITWILIADGAQARVFEHTGPGKGLVPVKGFSMDGERQNAREVPAERSGRGGNGIGGSVESRANQVAQRESDFVRAVADKLNRHRYDGDFQRLVIAAAPVALGDMRPHLSEDVKKVILAELPKDLTNIPTAKLGSHFEDLLAV
jgi:protein required for attachment to host cells